MNYFDFSQTIKELFRRVYYKTRCFVYRQSYRIPRFTHVIGWLGEVVYQARPPDIMGFLDDIVPCHQCGCVRFYFPPFVAPADLSFWQLWLHTNHI